jgi:uncharacterized protein YbcV (DUF1398 family)
MNAHVNSVVIACTEGSDAGTLTFPQVIGMLMEVGVERYYADLCRRSRTYYMPDGESYVIGARGHETVPAADFDPECVIAALRAIQAKSMGYSEFCEQILAAGCVGYIVTLAGRRAIYLGRKGEVYVELFPGAKS